jgi:hypothetical protein
MYRESTARGRDATTSEDTMTTTKMLTIASDALFAEAARLGVQHARRDLAAALRNIAAGFNADSRTVARDAYDAGNWAMPADEGIEGEAADAYCEAYDGALLDAAEAEEEAFGARPC